MPDELDELISSRRKQPPAPPPAINAAVRDDVDSLIESRRSVAKNRGAKEREEAIRFGAGNFAQGLSGAFGAPVDITANAMDFVTGGHFGFSKSPFLGGRQFQEISQSTPEIVGQPETAAGRFGARAGKEAAFGVGLATGAVGGGKQLLTRAAPAVQQGLVQGKSLVGDLLRGAARRPAPLIAGEAVAGASAGVGGQAVEEGGGGPLQQVGGEFAGGLAPSALTLSPTVAAVKLGRDVASRFSGPARRAAATSEAAKLVGPGIGPAQQADLDLAQRLNRETPGFNPTLAEATGAPSLVRTQERLQAEAQGPELEALVSRFQSSQASVLQASNAAAPTSDLSLADLQRALEGRVAAASGRVEGAANAVTDAQRQLAQSTTPAMTIDARGAQLRSSLTDARNASSIRMSKLASDLRLDKTDLTEPFRAISDELVKSVELKQRLFDDKADIPGIIKELKTANVLQPTTGGTAVRFKDYLSLRERISADIRRALAGDNPRPRKAAILVSMDRQLDGLQDELFRDVDPSITERYAQFRTTYLNDHIKRFRQGAAFDATKMRGRAEFATVDEKVSSLFFRRDATGGVTAAKQYREIFGDNPQARDLYRDAALDAFQKFAVDDAVVNPKKAQKFIDFHAQALGEYPDIAREIRGVGARAAALQERSAQLAMRRRRIDSAFLAREVQKIERGSDINATLTNSLTNPRLARQLVNATRGDPQLQGALRREIWGKVIGEGLNEAQIPRTPENLSKRVLQFMADDSPNSKSLRILFDNDHLEKLADIHAANIMGQRVAPPRGTASEIDPNALLQRQFGVALPQVASRVFAVRSGRTSFRFIIAEMFSRLVNRATVNEADAIIREALFDPKVARDLHAAMFRSGKGSEVRIRRLYGHLVDNGLAPLAFPQEDEQNGPAQ